MMFYVEIALKDLSIFPPSDKEYFHPLFQSLKVDPTWLKRADNVLLA